MSTYIMDEQRHMACIPYSIEGLHAMAEDLGIKRCWFHKDHYDCPKKRFDELKQEVTMVSSRDMHVVVRQGLVPAWLDVVAFLDELDEELDDELGIEPGDLD